MACLTFIITGSQLFIKEKNNPSSTYINLALSPLETNKNGISREIKLNLSLGDIITIFPLDKETKMNAQNLKSRSIWEYGQWISLARNLYDFVRRYAHGRKIKLSF